MTEKEKITEQLMVMLNEEILLEMAYPLKEIYRKIDDKVDVVVRHLILCLVFSKVSNETMKHWQAEVYNNMHRTWKIKGTNKLPTYKQLKTNCLDTWSDTLKNSLPKEISSLAKIEDFPAPKYNVDKLYESIISYFEWLFQQLSQAESITYAEIVNKIDELNEYYN